METLSHYLKHDHDCCDALFEQVERDVRAQDWHAATTSMATFAAALERHIAMEEQVLYPAFERAAVHARQPATMLRTEHRQLRVLLRRMGEAVESRMLHDFVLHEEAFTMLRHHHSAKEDMLLYPFLDQLLTRECSTLLAAMQALHAEPAPA